MSRDGKDRKARPAKQLGSGPGYGRAASVLAFLSWPGKPHLVKWGSKSIRPRLAMWML